MNSLTELGVVLFLCLSITTHQNCLRKCQVNNNKEKNNSISASLLQYLWKLL